MSDLGRQVLQSALHELGAMKRQAERALEQVSDEQLNLTLDPDSNSLGLIVKHLAGNMRSRWTDFLTSDGEKPDRNRDGEFEGALSRAEMMAAWQRGWNAVIGAIQPLGPDDLIKTVTIRGERHTVIQAIDRQLTHYAGHIGQIVFLAKHLAGPRWKTLSIPRGQSASILGKPRPM